MVKDGVLTLPDDERDEVVLEFDLTLICKELGGLNHPLLDVVARLSLWIELSRNELVDAVKGEDSKEEDEEDDDNEADELIFIEFEAFNVLGE